MQEQIVAQLVQVLQERTGLDPEKAKQVANVVIEFAQQHAGELLTLATAEGGEGGVQGMLGNVGKLLGR